MDELAYASDATGTDWLAARLGGPFGAVSRTVPTGFAAYARVLHPASGEGDRPVRWSEVAAATGRTVHPLVQWHALVGSADPYNAVGSLWQGQQPQRGALAPAELAELCTVLVGHATTPDHCTFAVWEGWGGLRSGPDGALLRLPQRSYVLLKGPVAAATRVGHEPQPGWFLPQPPNLFWPEDRAWSVATEIDFDSTLVGGSRDLVAALLAHPGLEAWPVRPDDSLAHDADLLNPAPRTG